MKRLKFLYHPLKIPNHNSQQHQPKSITYNYKEMSCQFSCHLLLLLILQPNLIIPTHYLLPTQLSLFLLTTAFFYFIKHLLFILRNFSLPMPTGNLLLTIMKHWCVKYPTQFSLLNNQTNIVIIITTIIIKFKTKFVIKF